MPVNSSCCIINSVKHLWINNEKMMRVSALRHRVADDCSFLLWVVMVTVRLRVRAALKAGRWRCLGQTGGVPEEETLMSCRVLVHRDRGFPFNFFYDVIIILIINRLKILKINQWNSKKVSTVGSKIITNRVIYTSTF